MEENESLNKHIIVTGGSSGIGQSVALYFLNCGAQVVIAGQDVDSMREIYKKFDNATIMKFDLSKDIHIYDFKTSVVERLKTIDIIVNCAAVKLDGDIEKTFPQDFDYTLDLNLRSVFGLIKNLAGFLNDNASIINISCLYGTRPMYGMISYCMSKAGIEALTRYAAAEFSPLGIRVNAVTACPVDTNSMRLIKVSETEIDYFKKKMEKNIPLGRIALPDDIVKAIVFLASERSKRITGQIIKVDGGRSLTSSGYVHYKGIMNMNTRFEPDAEKALSWVSNLIPFSFNKNKEFKDENEIAKFVEEKMKESNFSSKSSDAYYINTYKNVEISPKREVKPVINPKKFIIKKNEPQDSLPKNVSVIKEENEQEIQNSVEGDKE
jgi:NAD(P)-dependent dehydrogenase (short-subunit alcohol dehydrogenase family)